MRDPAPDLAVLRLGRTRRLLADRRGKVLAGLVASLYFAISLLAGGMLRLEGGLALLLPVGSTLAMLGVATAVGLGMGAGLRLAWRLYAAPRSPSERARALGPLASLTPAMMAALSLGACCSTAAAAWAGLGIFSASAEMGVLLALVQFVVLLASLLAQEAILSLLPEAAWAPRPAERRPRARGTRWAGPRVSRFRWTGVAAGSLWAGLFVAELRSPSGWVLGEGGFTELHLGNLGLLGALWALTLLPAVAIALGRRLGLEGPAPATRALLLFLGSAALLGTPTLVPGSGPPEGRGTPRWSDPTGLLQSSDLDPVPRGPLLALPFPTRRAAPWGPPEVTFLERPQGVGPSPPVPNSFTLGSSPCSWNCDASALPHAGAATRRGRPSLEGCCISWDLPEGIGRR